MFVVGKPSRRSAQAERPRRRDERNRAHAGVPAFAGTTANIHFVVPANAGTHNHRCLLLESRRAAALKLKGRGVAMSAIALTRGSLRSQGRRLIFTSSSLRTQGPITTDVYCWKAVALQRSS